MSALAGKPGSAELPNCRAIWSPDDHHGPQFKARAGLPPLPGPENTFSVFHLLPSSV
jgi:hypothetical protein